MGDEEAAVAAEDNREVSRVVRGLRHVEHALGLAGQTPPAGLGGRAFDPQAHNCLIARFGGFLTVPRSQEEEWASAC